MMNLFAKAARSAGLAPRKRRHAFTVRVDGDIEAYRAGDRSIVFHAINKSGSKALAEVIRLAYESAGRGQEFVRPGVTADLHEAIRARDSHAFFWDHLLYGAVIPAPGKMAITQLRHPLPRVLSLYQWLKNKHIAAGRDEADFVPLQRFVRKSGGVHYSMMAQIGIGYGGDHRAAALAAEPREVLARAIENLEQNIHWFGIAEQFEETIYILAAICGLGSVPAWKRDNRNPNRPLAWDLPQADQDMILDVFRHDLAFYEHGLKLFRERLQRLSLGGDFEAYRQACRGQYKDRIEIAAPGA